MLRKSGMRTLMPFLTSWGDPDASRTSCAVVTGGKTDTASSKTVGIPLCQPLIVLCGSLRIASSLFKR